MKTQPPQDSVLIKPETKSIAGKFELGDQVR
jgi:hypothetical protein